MMAPHLRRRYEADDVVLKGKCWFLKYGMSIYGIVLWFGIFVATYLIFIEKSTKPRTAAVNMIGD